MIGRLMHSVLETITSASHVVVIAHVNPDADSMGAASAMYSQLLRWQKKATLFCATERIDPRLAFLPWFDKMRHQFPASADLAICFDCGTYARLGVDVPCPLINFDHHASNEAYGDKNLIDVTAISTTQVLYDFFTAAGIRPNAKMATALYAGLLDDSHAFLSAKTDERTFATAQELVRLGAQIRTCATELFERHTLAALRIKGLMLKELQLRCDGKVAVLLVSRGMMEATGARAVDCEAALEESAGLPTVEAALMLRENRDGSIKGSLRSVRHDVAGIAKTLGGGGHPHASGFDFENMPLEDAFDKAMTLLQKEMM
jgi:phosphoesterase RecJ-like protein